MNNNMEDMEKKLAADADKVRMLKSEKEAVRHRVLEAPFTAEAEPASPRYTLAAYLVSMRDSRSARVVLASLVVLAVLGAPLTYAAQESGPGDVLHGLETEVVEKVQEILHFSASARADYHIERLEERLEEIVAMNDPADAQASAGERFSEEEYGQAAQNISEHTAKVLATLPRLEGDRETLGVLVRASAVLDAQEKILDDGQAPEFATDLVDEANDAVGEELMERIEDYVTENNPVVLIGTVREEIAEVQALADAEVADVTAPEVKEHLEDALAEVRAGELDQALRSVLEAQVDALAQGYLGE